MFRTFLSGQFIVVSLPFGRRRHAPHSQSVGGGTCIGRFSCLVNAALGETIQDLPCVLGANVFKDLNGAQAAYTLARLKLADVLEQGLHPSPHFKREILL